MHRVIIIIIALMTSACAKNIEVTYFSAPSGAALYQAGQMVGTTPVTLVYQVTPQDRAAGAKELIGPSVVWASGARASVANFVLQAAAGKYQHTFGRPEHPGLQTDLEVDARLATEKEMRRQANMARDARVIGQLLESTSKSSGNYYYIAQ